MYCSYELLKKYLPSVTLDWDVLQNNFELLQKCLGNVTKFKRIFTKYKILTANISELLTEHSEASTCLHSFRILLVDIKVAFKHRFLINPCIALKTNLYRIVLFRHRARRHLPPWTV